MRRCSHVLRAGLLALIAVASALPAAAQDPIPLLPEDTPSDVRELGLGPWNGAWIIRSSQRGNVEVTTYFCSHEVAGVCFGRLYLRPEAGTCEAGCLEGECSGPCEGVGSDSESAYHRGCTTDADCPITDRHETCDDAKSDAAEAADTTCRDKGGAACVCFTHARVTSKSGTCKQGALAKYCKYRCAAAAKGSCAPNWVTLLPTEP